MKMIDVLIKLANDEIKDQTTLKIYDHADTLYTSYTFEEKFNSFYSNTKYRIGLGDYFKISGNFLNLEAKLIPPKEKKYLIKVNVQWFDKGFAYLNYDKQRNCVIIYTEVETITYKTQFTKQELQSIKPIREFLEDMEGKYELIEVEDNEID